MKDLWTQYFVQQGSFRDVAHLSVTDFKCSGCFTLLSAVSNRSQANQVTSVYQINLMYLFFTTSDLTADPRRGMCNKHDGGGGVGSDGASCCKPKKMQTLRPPPQKWQISWPKKIPPPLPCILWVTPGQQIENLTTVPGKELFTQQGQIFTTTFPFPVSAYDINILLVLDSTLQGWVDKDLYCQRTTPRSKPLPFCIPFMRGKQTL